MVDLSTFANCVGFFCSGQSSVPRSVFNTDPNTITRMYLKTAVSILTNEGFVIDDESKFNDLIIKYYIHWNTDITISSQNLGVKLDNLDNNAVKAVSALLNELIKLSPLRKDMVVYYNSLQNNLLAKVDV